LTLGSRIGEPGRLPPGDGLTLDPLTCRPPPVSGRAEEPAPGSRRGMPAPPGDAVPESRFRPHSGYREIPS